MSAVDEVKARAFRNETDCLGQVQVPADKLWGVQTPSARGSVWTEVGLEIGSIGTKE
jgi:hypothetical protein